MHILFHEQAISKMSTKTEKGLLKMVDSKMVKSCCPYCSKNRGKIPWVVIYDRHTHSPKGTITYFLSTNAYISLVCFGFMAYQP